MPSHAALTSAGAQGFGVEKGVSGWRWDPAWSSETGGGEDATLRMLLALKSHLVITLSQHPEGG